MCLYHFSNILPFLYQGRQNTQLYIRWTMHRDTRTSERPTRCTLFLNNLFQLNYPRHVSKKWLFIIRSVPTAYIILPCIFMSNLVVDKIQCVYEYLHLSLYFSTQSPPRSRHLSSHGTNLLTSALQNSVPCDFNHLTTAVFIFLSLANSWPQIWSYRVVKRWKSLSARHGLYGRYPRLSTWSTTRVVWCSCDMGLSVIVHK